jgi:hypothetical protein
VWRTTKEPTLLSASAGWLEVLLEMSAMPHRLLRTLHE